MPLHPDSSPCTAMSTPLGPMQWKVVPMGAKNGNAAFQRMMEDLLGPVRDCANPFVDDIIGSGTEDMTEDELIGAHEKDLRRVLSKLEKHNMVCKPTKASLFVREVDFAGHVVGHGQRRPMPVKLATLHHWEKPQTISELRSFMGFCNYYSGYVRMYAELSGPLHKMLQVGKFDGRKGNKKKLAWTPEAEDAFSRLKERLLGQLGLFLVDPNKGFVLRTDASDYAVGASLEQFRDDGVHVPVAFWSRILAEGQRRTWTAREKETYAIVCALRKWSGHIGIQSVVVCTDHQSLQSWHKKHVDTPSRPAARRADGMRRSPSSTSASYTSRGRTTLWRIASVDCPTPLAKHGWTYPAMGTPRRLRRPSASSRLRRPWSKSFVPEHQTPADVPSPSSSQPEIWTLMTRGRTTTLPPRRS